MRRKLFMAENTIILFLTNKCHRGQSSFYGSYGDIIKIKKKHEKHKKIVQCKMLCGHREFSLSLIVLLVEILGS